MTATIGGSSFDVIFDDDYDEDFAIEASDPQFLCVSADLTTAGGTHGSTVTISGTNYTIINLRPDGTGLTRVVLEEQ